MKLSPQQNKVIYAMRNGWKLSVEYGSRVVTCYEAEGKGAFDFSLQVFRNLIDNEFIYQSYAADHDYILTSRGAVVKTRIVSLN